MLARAKRWELFKVLDHIVNAADGVSDLGAAGLVNIPPGVSVLAQERFMRKKVGHDVLHHQLIV